MDTTSGIPSLERLLFPDCLFSFFQNNTVFFSTLVSVIGFCLFILFSFLYLEGNAFHPDYSYNPPSIIDGKVKDGNFSK